MQNFSQIGEVPWPRSFNITRILQSMTLKYHLAMIHCYADDSQIYISFSPNDRAEQLAVVKNLEDCIRDIRFWMFNNGLKLNDDKTEFLIIGTSQQLGKLDNISIRVRQTMIQRADPGLFLGGGAPLRNDVTDGEVKKKLKAITYIRRRKLHLGGGRTPAPSPWIRPWILRCE